MNVRYYGSVLTIFGEMNETDFFIVGVFALEIKYIETREVS